MMQETKSSAQTSCANMKLADQTKCLEKIKNKKKGRNGAQPPHTEQKHPLCYFEMLCVVRGQRVFQLNAYMLHREEHGVWLHATCCVVYNLEQQQKNTTC